MRLLFITIAVVVIYRLIFLAQTMSNIVQSQLFFMFDYLGNIVLILVLCLSVRDTVKNMQRQEKISSHSIIEN